VVVGRHNICVSCRELLGKYDSVFDALSANFDVEGYRQPLIELVRTGKSSGATAKVLSMAGQPINFPSIGKPIILKRLMELKEVLRDLQPSQ